MDIKDRLGDPKSLSGARVEAHAAAQLIARAARANAAPAPDGSHTALVWMPDRGALRSAPIAPGAPGAPGTPIAPGDTPIQIALELAPLRLVVLRAGAELHALTLPGQTLTQAEDWLDARLEALGLGRASAVALPYELPGEVAQLDRFALEDPGRGALSAWFELAADALEAIAREFADLDPGRVLCWPHHFDIATYIGLEQGDPETARGIGVGMSPGDETYNEPYFYVNPWPHPDPAQLPRPIPPGHWHLAGFVGSIATGSEILSLADPVRGTERFLHESFEADRALLAT